MSGLGEGALEVGVIRLPRLGVPDRGQDHHRENQEHWPDEIDDPSGESQDEARRQNDLESAEELLGVLDKLLVVDLAEGLKTDRHLANHAHSVLLRAQGGRGPRGRLSAYSIAPFGCFVKENFVIIKIWL